MLKILVVDDEIPMRDLVAQVIARRETEFQVVGVAGDGAQALELARRTSPDIVITDIYMPVCGGIEFLQRAQAEGLRFKTIIISGHDEFECAKQAIFLGVTDYLLKPFLPSELFDVMEKIRTEMERQRMLEQNMAALRSLVDQQQRLLGEKLYAQLARGTLRSEPPKGSREAELFDFRAQFFCAGYFCDRQMSGSSAWDAVRDEELLSLLSEYFDSSVKLHCARMNETQTALLFSGGGESEETFLLNLRSGLSRCQTSLRKHCDIQLRCAIGRVRRDWRQLCESYEEARAVWRLQMKSEQMLLVYGESATKPHDDAQLSNPDLSLEMVAGRFNFSPHYIRQIFKQHHGEAFSDYVIRKRMERAGTLLRTSGMLVQDVALACGYANQRYFASSFKKYYGQTPTDFKQALEQKEQKK